MKKEKAIILTIAVGLAAVVIFGALIPTKRENFFITQPGVYHLLGENITLEVYTDDNGYLNIKSTYPGKEGTWEDGWIDPDSDWFLYIERVNEVWLQHGEELDFIFEYEDVGGIYSLNQYPNVILKDAPLIETIPKEVFERMSQSALDEIKKIQQVGAINSDAADSTR